MGGLTASIAEAKAKADPMTVARFARLSPEYGARGGAKFLCPFQADGKSWANFFKKTEGPHVGHLAFGCAACAAEARQPGKRMPDAMAALQHVLGCSLPAALDWLQAVNKGQEPPPPPATNKPATAPKVETWESPIKGTPLGLRVIFGRPGAWDEAKGCLHVALCKHHWEFAQWYQETYGDLSNAAIVAVNDPAEWIVLKSPLPAKLRGQLYYRSEPTAHHLDFQSYAATKGCTYELVDLDQVERKLASAANDEDQEGDAEEEEVAPARTSPSTPAQAKNEADDELKRLSTTLPTPPVAGSTTREPTPKHPARTPDVIASPAATARSTPVDPGRLPPTTPVDDGRPSSSTPPPAQLPVTDSPKADAALARRLVETPGIARKFLADILAAGPVLAQEAVRLGRAQHLGRGAVHQAKAELGVVCDRDHRWHLP